MVPNGMTKDINASLYLWSNRLFRVLHGGSQALFEGVWMGLLPECTFDATSEKSYGAGEAYTGAAWLDSGFHFWEELAVRKVVGRSGERMADDRA
jgi:hypothetical protein